MRLWEMDPHPRSTLILPLNISAVKQKMTNNGVDAKTKSTASVSPARRSSKARGRILLYHISA